MSDSERSSRNKAHRYALTLPVPEAPGHRQPGFALFLLAVVLFIAARLWRLGAFGLWGDEITSLEVVRLAWSGLFAFIKADVVHPPLFYVLLKLWVGIGGDSLAWLRLFPVLTAIATIVPFYLLGRELNIPSGQMGLALLLAAVNGYLVYYGQELRMYGLMLFLTVCSLWWFARFFNSARWVNLVVLSAVNLLLVYTHYFGWLVVGVEFIFLMFRGGRPFYQFAAA